MSFLLRQWQLFLLALSFFSRLPVPASLPYSPERLNQSGRYICLVGWVLGALQALLLYGLLQLFSPALAVLLMLIAGLVLTGVFHEDGLADTADGLGGGQQLSDKLRILKDSRIGSYGTAAFVLVMLLKWQSLQELNSQAVWAVLVVAALSRLMPVLLISSLNYQQADAVSKSKPLVSQSGSLNLGLNLLVALLPLYWLPWSLSLSLCTTLLLGFGLCRHYFKSQLGGYTGDLLGAAQQVTEVALYIIWLLVWTHN
ncbi:adenosylcobinamide-GDP ribazoletransferase [Rheinheimera sp.]|uniref:adenosylcobinamide-GDP ribazoletransferase n=1 Tax=Rheinheimera sp. TaxID=1869214 RepID=UPI00307E0CD4